MPQGFFGSGFSSAVSAAILSAVLLWGAEDRYELRGRLEPPRERVLVTVDGSTSPYTASVTTDSRGRFRFPGLTAGPYTLKFYVPGLDEIRQTVEVSRSLAGKSGRVEVVIPYDPSGPGRQALERRHAVSARELSLPAAAKREYQTAQTLLGKNDVEGATRRLEKAVEIAPQFIEAWNNLGTIAYHANRFQDAERFFRTALEHEPGSYTPSVNLGGVLLSLRRYTEALDYNRYAVGQQPRDALANVQLGMNYFYLGRPDPALKYLLEAKRLDPNHFSFPQLFLAEIYFGRGKPAEAVAELEDFLRRHPDAPQAEAARKVVAARSGRRPADKGTAGPRPENPQ